MKGLFTQGAALLVNSPVPLFDLELLLRPFGEVSYKEPFGDWTLGTETLLIPFSECERGRILVDFIPRPWPDDMGDPETAPILLAAWSMGHFGPFAYPGNFQRACEQAWMWPEAKTSPPTHSGFIRIRSSYAEGAKPDDPVFPPDYQPLTELEEFTKVVAALCEHPAVICYFNPSGEMVLPPEKVAKLLARAAASEFPPLEMWSNARLYNLAGLADGWILADTVGMRQLDLPDFEACFPAGRYEAVEVVGFLRDTALYVMANGPVIKDRHTLDGPGGVHWQARHFEEALLSPPRPVLRLFPLDGSQPPKKLREA